MYLVTNDGHGCLRGPAHAAGRPVAPVVVAELAAHAAARRAVVMPVAERSVAVCPAAEPHAAASPAAERRVAVLPAPDWRVAVLPAAEPATAALPAAQLHVVCGPAFRLVEPAPTARARDSSTAQAPQGGSDARRSTYWHIWRELRR